MAKLIVNKKVIGNFDVGTKFQDIHDLIEKAGVEFGCTDGQCGVCVATVLRGLEALNEVSEKRVRYSMAYRRIRRRQKAYLST